MSPGEKRRRKAKRERDRARHQAAYDALKALGASCATCRHFAKAPFSLGGKGHICERDSDFEGYVRTTASDLCINFAQKL